MSAIPVISSRSPALFVNPDESRQWTDVKIKKAWLYAASGIAMAGAALAVGAAVSMPCMSFLVAAIPLAIASAAMAIYSRSLVDYEDPKTLDSLRMEALLLPLPKVVEKHGWSKIFSYCLLDNAHFQAAYRTHANTLPFSEIIGLYHRACDGLKKAKVCARRLDFYSIPLPKEWKSKFIRETENLGCLDILDRYPVSDLQEFGVITPAQKKVLDEASMERKAFNGRSDQLECKFRDATPMQHAVLRSAKEIAELNYRLHPVHAALAQIDLGEMREKASLDSICSRIRHERSCLEAKRRQLPQGCDPNKIREIDEAIGRLRREEQASSFYPLRSLDWQSRRLDSNRALSLAREIRDQSIRMAQDQFRIDTRPERQRIDALHAHNKARFDAQMAKYDKQYRS